MATHIKILGWLHIVFGCFGLLLALTVGGGMMLGSMFAGSFRDSAIVGILGGFAGIMIGGFAALQLILGWGLLTKRQWARILGIVLGVISLIRFPLGTALGIYTLWVLLSKDGSAEFASSI